MFLSSILVLLALFRSDGFAIELGETVIYQSNGVTQGRSSPHRAGLKLGEVTGFPHRGMLKVTPWDYPNRFYPGKVVGLDGRLKDGSEVVSDGKVFREVTCFRDESGLEYRIGTEKRLQVSKTRFENRHAMRIFENGFALFFRNKGDEEAYQSLGNRLFFEKLSPTLIRPIYSSKSN